MAEYIVGANGKLGRTLLKYVKGIPLVRRRCNLKGERIVDFRNLFLEDATKIYHVAGSLTNPHANIEITEAVIDAVPEECKIIYASSVSVYGKKLKEPANESTPVAPDSAYAQSKLECEKMLLKRGNCAILRLGPLYGEEFEDFFKFLALIEKGKAFIVGDGSNKVPFTAAEDVCKVFKKAESGLYVLAGDPLTQKEIIEYAAHLLNAPKPKHLPYLVALLLAKTKGWSKEHIDVLYHDRVFDCSKAKRELGFRPIPLKKGIEKMVKKYKERPL